MGFLAPLVGIGMSAAGGLFGGPSKQQKQLTDTQAQAAKWGLNQAQTVLPRGLKDLSSVEDFWKPLLSGDRTQMFKTLAPEISNVSAQYQTARNQDSEFSGRSGGRGAILSGSRFNQAGVISNLLNTSRFKAADAMTNLGNILSSLGINVGHLGESSAAGAQAGINAQDEKAAKTGQGIGNIIGMLLGPGGLLNQN